MTHFFYHSNITLNLHKCCHIKHLLSRCFHHSQFPNTFDVTVLPSLIKASQSQQYALQLHCLALKSGSSSDAVVSNSLISVYAKSSNLRAARQVFDTMPYRDTITWNSIINCYIQNGHPSEALQMLKQMYFYGFVPKPELLACIVSVCARSRRLRLGREIHALVVTDGRIQEESVFLSTALLDLYFKCHCSTMALHVFDRMAVKNEVSWSSMISGCAAAHNYDMAMYCFRAMQVEGVKPNRVTLIAILPVCAHLGCIKHGKEIHGYAVRRGFHSDPHCSAALMHMYCTSKETSPAAKLIFERSTVRDVVMWSSIIASYARHGNKAKAIKLFNLMQEEGIEPNSITLLAVISACTSLDLAGGIHCYTLKSGVTFDISIGNALINMYAKCGCVEAARRVFMEIPIKDSISWSTLIDGYGVHGRGEQALELFHEMEKAGVEADQVTFLSVLSACNHAGLVEEGQEIFHRLMKGSDEIPLTMEHYACYIDLLGRAGKIEDACKVVRAIPVEASPRIWTSLISCCKLHGRMEVAEVLAQQLVESEPENAANHTLLSMVYAETGNWRGVEEVRRAMQVKRLQKCQGLSQIQLEN
ncbi:pentatricopeptide repeat-containing protein At4g31070, mitochondrial [Humulus lupulus]|uniref:pentatricopeptide repeat-containing protein At4g31070, mitochondrial n=1 Tax=Humulus lupulus TaxID=3486 RepID=UPI002B4048F6|nr:pentatricopeptide repeat-containing protein At4g31070, mitochondrial [Humulus lupulus]